MSDTTDIEKKSLEAHVELCAERYRFLETKMNDLEEEIVTVKTLVQNLQGMMQQVVEKRNDQIIAWGVGIIGVMAGVIAWLATKVL